MSERKHGDQRVPDDDAAHDPELYVAAAKALTTPLVQAAWDALEVVAEQHGLQACDPDGDCTFPQCLALGCEAEPKDADAAPAATKACPKCGGKYAWSLGAIAGKDRLGCNDCGWTWPAPAAPDGTPPGREP